MHLFIDTNILVGFYEASNESLMELEKLKVMLKKGKLRLWLPDQVEKEFWKHREPSIAKSLSAFEKGGVMGSPPLLVKEDKDFPELKKLVAAVEKQRTEIITRIRKEVFEEKTKADDLVRGLFSAATKIEADEKLFNVARERALRHLPPGKNDGLGDRLCWEALLKAVPPKEPLYILSDDGDYSAEGDGDAVCPYLRHEWRKKKDSDVYLVKRASKFLAVHVPDAATAIEAEHTLSVQALKEAGNFAMTHRAIAEFTGLNSLNAALAEQLGRAIVDNSQVHWIIKDNDVKEFVSEFLKYHSGKLSRELRAQVEEILAAAG